MTTTTKTKLTRGVLAGFMICTMALSTATSVVGGSTVHADETVVPTPPNKLTINLHKKAVMSASETQNTGHAMAEFDALDGVNHVTFTAFEISAMYQKIKSENKFSDKQTADYISDNWDQLQNHPDYTYTTVDSKTTTSVGEGDDKVDGIATFSGLDTQNSDGSYKIYLFEETGGSANMTKAAPLVVGALQYDSVNEEYFSSMVLYPKNAGIEKTMYDEEGLPVDDEKVISYEVGTEVPYDTTLTLDKNLDRKILSGEDEGEYAYDNLTFMDSMDAAGTELVGRPTITYEGMTGTNLLDQFEALDAYTDSNDDDWDGHAGFKIDLQINGNEDDPDLAALLKEISGKTLTFTYTMRITEDIVTYNEVENTFEASLKKKGEEAVTIMDESAKIETGGHTFTKVDSTTPSKGLKDAEFVLKRQVEVDGEKVWQYAKFDYGMTTDEEDNPVAIGEPTDGNYNPETIDWIELDDDDEATILAAQASGKITTITSGTDDTGTTTNETGNISLKGLKGGKDYVLYETKAPNGFTITNASTAFSVKNGATGTSAIDHQDIDNTPDQTPLPLTGGVGILGFLLAGLAAMGGARIWNKKRKA